MFPSIKKQFIFHAHIHHASAKRTNTWINRTARKRAQSKRNNRNYGNKKTSNLLSESLLVRDADKRLLQRDGSVLGTKVEETFARVHLQ